MSTTVFAHANAERYRTFPAKTDRYKTLCTNSDGYGTFYANADRYDTFALSTAGHALSWLILAYSGEFWPIGPSPWRLSLSPGGSDSALEAQIQPWRHPV